MKANVMFYHTSDRDPRVLDRCGTMVEARGLMRRYVKNASGIMSPHCVREDGDRVEFRFPGFAFAYYVEPAE